VRAIAYVQVPVVRTRDGEGHEKPAAAKLATAKLARKM
jgi:hypothetical protein